MTGRTTGVVGAGLMGADIAAMLANGGYEVVLVDVDPDALAAARERHAGGAPEALVEAGLREAGAPPLAERITYTDDLAALADCEFVVEAVSEDLDLKRTLLADIEAVVAEDAVLATNTSSLTPTDVAADLQHPGRVTFFHFANPPIKRDVVEVGGVNATEEAYRTTVEVGEGMGKWVAELAGEGRAHCLSRISAAIKCAGTWELLEAEPAAINVAASNLGFPRGPLELIDLIGIDVHLATVDNLHDSYDGRFDPPADLRERMERMVDEDRMGKKSGTGFYEWDGDDPVVPEVESGHDIAPIVGAMVSEAHRIVADGITDADTLDEILQRGGGGDLGPFGAQELLGAGYLVDVLEARYEATGAAIYEPAAGLRGAAGE
ncbi:3-hydroxyacyl-CoA dehydrogenase family protein [Haloglomus litoreum]|uniref:3-hydroxyacyl-CoA dehydrogenase family protein n=1 Tax=Haloglomus litoreum TaxID=3034026 RepID=UPI0023E75C77|nr:3-hydroxyacyl-CoA dehydrogenase family protein [Haloglomus sp. DT116]